MSADDKGAECPAGSLETACRDDEPRDQRTDEICDKKEKRKRKVCFPDDDQIVTQYFEPANPWQDVPPTSRSQLAAEYLDSCRRHDTDPLDCVLQQIRELPESCIGGASRAAKLTLCDAALVGPAPADALEAMFKRTQFRKIELQATMDDQAAEALFDMVEYYESATAIVLSGPRHFGIRGWQAASRMIKRSCHLQELEISNHPLESSHAPVLARALHTHSCQLRTLCLQGAVLSGDSLLCLVIALKSNNSVRELRLADNRLTCADALQIASLLRYNTRLQLLDLSNNQIQDAGAGHIADALADQAHMNSHSANTSPLSPTQCPVRNYEARGLAFLVLWNNQLTRNCAHHLSKALTSQSLCVLNVGRNAVGADAVRALAAAGNTGGTRDTAGTVGTALVSLGLQCARLGPDCGTALRELLAGGTRLQRLDLRDNKLGGAALQAILNGLKENKTLTQIDLDEPNESTTTLTAEESEAATVARLTREIRAICRNNELAASPERRAHRKISLTCYSAAHLPNRPGAVSEADRRGKLRSPLPSPAGSPTPATHAPSRFSVTRVTPDRQLSSSVPTTPTRTTHSPTSRFKVVQVAEPPTIHIHTPEPTRKSNRFSVTRNTDSSYNVTPVPSPPPSMPSVGTDPTRVPAFDIDSTIGATPPRIKDLVVSDIEDEEAIKVLTVGDSGNVSGERIYERSEVKQTTLVDSNKGDKNNEKTADKLSDVKIEIDFCIDEKYVETSENANVHKTIVNIGNENKDIVKSGVNSNADTQKRDNTYHDKSDQLSHSKEVGTVGNIKLVKIESNSVTNTTEIRETGEQDVQVQVTVKSDVLDIEKIDKSLAKVHSDHITEYQTIDENLNSHKEDLHKEIPVPNLLEKRDKKAVKQIEAITEDLGQLIEDVKELSSKTACLKRKDVESDDNQTKIHIESSQTDEMLVIESMNVVKGNVNVILKKNKSESSLGSPDLEVSRLMSKRVIGSPFCDSSSSLEISGSSMESLSALDQSNNPNSNIRLSNIHILPKPVVIEEDTELDRRKLDQMMLSTESSIESNISEAAPVNTGNFLNMSLSSNESVSPIIFSAKKIHGSLSSLEASVSSLDSVRQERTMATSADSGIEYSIQNPTEKDVSSNEGTLTHNTNLKESCKIDSVLQDTLTCSPKRTSSLLDVPALKNKGLDRMRKISWVAPSSSFQLPKAEPEKETKLPSHLEKLLSLFQHPTSLFRSSQNEDEKKCNTPPRKDSSLTSSFWSWGSSSDKEKETTEVLEISTTERNTLVTPDTSVDRGTPVAKDASLVTEVLKTSEPSAEVQKKSESYSSPKVSQGNPDQNLSEEVTLLSCLLTQFNLEMPQAKHTTSQITKTTEVSQSTSEVTHWGSNDFKTSDSSVTHVTFSVQDDSSSTDSTLSERAQIAFIDESFSRKLDSKTSSTDTENTLNEYQSAQISFDSITQDKFSDCENQSRDIVSKESSSCLKCEKKVTDENKTTDISNAVQSLDISECFDSSNGNQCIDNPRASDITDLIQPNDMNKNYEAIDSCENKDFETRIMENDPNLETIRNVNPEDKAVNTKHNTEVIVNVTNLENVEYVNQERIQCESLINETTELLENITRNTTSFMYDKSSCQSSAETSTKYTSQENPDTINKLGDAVLLTSEKSEETKEHTRSRSFAAVLKASVSENSLEKPSNPDGEPVDKLPSKVIKGIKENISPENTLTASMTNTKTLTLELQKVKNQPIVNVVREMCGATVDEMYVDIDKLCDKETCLDKAGCYKDINDLKDVKKLRDVKDKDVKYIRDVKDDVESGSNAERPLKAPIATLDEACEDLPSQIDDENSMKVPFLDDITFIDEKTTEERDTTRVLDVETESVDLGKDALSYLLYENQDFDPENEATVSELKTSESSLAQELQDAEDKQKLIDLSPELIIEDTDPEVFSTEFITLNTSPVVSDRAQFKKASSLENILSRKDSTSPKTKTIAFKIPETSPRDIPRRPKLRSRSGSSPKSLPESLNKSCPLKLDSKKKKKVTSLGKMAKDSLLALNMTEEEIAELRRSYKLTSVESLKSLESVSEDANSQSGTSFDSRCRSCLRTSQESLMSLDSITEDCRCSEQDKGNKLSRSAR